MTCFSLLLALAAGIGADAPLHCAASGDASGARAQIKFATLAPEGTNAMKTMQSIDAEVKKQTSGRLGFKFYAGGRQGDEKDMVRKIRAGQLHSGGFTGVGLGEIAPEVRILDAPWLFKDAKEVDHVYGALAQDFERAFAANGYVLLGWTEVGFAHVFSNAPVRSPQDMKTLKIWVWEGDPIAEAAFKAIGVHPIPLSITDVNTSLQTGLINAVYSSPLYAMALQWHEKTKYIHSVPLANASGAVLVSKKLFDTLPPQDQQILLKVCREKLKTLNELTRQENEKALSTLKAQGMKMTDASPDAVKAYEEAGRSARRSLVGRLYPQTTLDRVERTLAEYRAKKTKKK
ncbi:MAG: TRAP transporter substrate-binding protein DctP [Elusimicrobiota bacterium]